MNIKVKGLNEYATAVCNEQFNNSIVYGNCIWKYYQICSHRLFFHPSNEAFLMNDSSSLYDARFSVARTQP